MPQPFQVIIHGSGFSIPVVGSKPAHGFMTIRRVLADNPEVAKERALAKLKQEERYRELLTLTPEQLGSHDGCKLRVEYIDALSWFRWCFSRQSSSFIFYSDDENDS